LVNAQALNVNIKMLVNTQDLQHAQNIHNHKHKILQHLTQNRKYP